MKKSDDDKNVYLVDSSAVEPFMGTLYDFAESGTFPSVTSSTITEVKVDKEDGYELTQDPDNLFWNVSDGKTSEKADTDKAGTVTSAIGSLAYDSFVDYNCTDDSKYGFDDPYAVITAKYTEEEAVEDDSEDAEDTSESTDETDTDSETSSEDESSTDSDTEDADSSDTEDDSEEEETKTVTVDKEITIYVGDETGSDRYVKVDDTLKNKEIKKIILSRPAVEAGEKLGFLPGDMKDKIDPYLQPLYDALQDMIPAAKLKEYMELNIIQIAPLAFMRGRTLNDAVVILDEAQNTTAQQIKMFLTRMGMNTKMIVTGDMTQIDLPASQTSGLVQALRILKGVKGISFVELNKKDIVRHKLVERIVDAYEKFDKEAKAEREKRKNEQQVINGERPVKQVNN